ncbi:MAG: hypothetical protein B7Y84_18525 [Azorhizobium sp. 32-67-21]|nr:MAG: hypothetical protein B7Y84_18525 [Azorhizobium sp. 32-67-21]
MTDWQERTQALATRTLQIRQQIALAARIRAKAHLEICDAHLAILGVEQDARHLVSDLPETAAFDQVEAALRLLEFVHQVESEASEEASAMRLTA